MKKPIIKKGVLDLFCGIGGFSKGFEKAGFEIKYGIDNWTIALETFKKNHQDSIAINSDVGSVSDAFYKKIKKDIGVIIAGPPCQGFSMAGKRETGDPRNKLFAEVIRAAKNIEPEIVIIENVVGILSMTDIEGKSIKDNIIQSLNNIGYNVVYKVLNAHDFSVPQSRRRVIFIASKRDSLEDIYPIPKKIQVTVGDAFENIPDVDETKYKKPKTPFQKEMSDSSIKIFNHKAMKHNDMVIKRIKNVPQGGNWQDIPKKIYNVGGIHSNNYRRLDPNRPSVTIKHATKSMIIHPHYDRVITAREAARLQSIPDNFIICGSVSEQHQQLANAVPVLLGFEIAKSLKKKYDF